MIFEVYKPNAKINMPLSSDGRVKIIYLIIFQYHQEFNFIRWKKKEAKNLQTSVYCTCWT